MLDADIIDAWKRRGVGEDDNDYEGRMNLVPPNNVAAAVERENQRAASAIRPLPMSANEEAVCAAGTLCQAPDHADINSSMHRCLLVTLHLRNFRVRLLLTSILSYAH
jgi:hypothetical protein